MSVDRHIGAVCLKDEISLENWWLVRKETVDSSRILENYEASNDYLLRTSLITTPFVLDILLYVGDKYD